MINKQDRTINEKLEIERYRRKHDNASTIGMLILVGALIIGILIY